MPLHLSRRAARTLMLIAQGLHRRPTVAATKSSVLEAIQRRFRHPARVLRRVANELEPRLEGHRARAMVEELQDIVKNVWGVQEPRERS